jgi:hypothetical protein
MPKTEFDSHLPYMGLQIGSLSVQQEKLVQFICSGMTIAAAGRASGYATPSNAYAAAKLEPVAQAIQYFREQMHEEVKFGIQQAHSMYMNAYVASANSTEMKNTVDSMVRLHGLAKESQSQQVNIQINGAKQLERLSDDELLKLAGKGTQYLEPQTNDK